VFTYAVRKISLNMIQISHYLPAALWLSRLVASLSPRRSGFNPRSVQVRFVVDRVVLGQVFLPVFRVSHLSIIPPVLHIHLQVRVARTRRTNRRSLGAFRKAVLFRKPGSVWSRCVPVLVSRNRRQGQHTYRASARARIAGYFVPQGRI